MSLYLPLFKALNDAKVQYVIVGGLATVLHGYSRLTSDIDLIVDLSQAEAEKAMLTLEKLGFKPRLPVPARQFADATIRAGWIADKGMKVFSFYHPGNPILSIDVFVHHPIPFNELHERAVIMEIDGISLYICSINDLITLKRQAGRPQDLIDIEKLEKIRQRHEQENSSNN
jgi:predicted nucleotidyltransferase